MKMILLILFFLKFTLCYAGGEGPHELNPKYIYTQNYVQAKGYKVATHTWTSSGNKKLFVTVHGYLDNCVYLQNLHRRLLSRGFDVYCYDLPGHGMSSGTPRGDIDHFSSYKVAAEKAIDARPLDYSHVYFFSHSTGSVGLTQLLLEGWKSPFEKIIFVSPLIRSYLWKLSTWAYQTPLGNFIKFLPTRRISLNDEFNAIVKNDPFPITKLPVHWYGELVNWNKSLERIKPYGGSEKLFTIFAEKDTVIEAEYSQRFYSKNFPKVEVKVIKKSEHVPYYEIKPIQDIFYDHFFNLLEQ